MKEAELYSSDGRSVPLLGVEVIAAVLGGFSYVKVRQRYCNAESKAIEAVYSFPLPSDATLAGFSMTCDGRHAVGEVQEREEALRADLEQMVETA